MLDFERTLQAWDDELKDPDQTLLISRGESARDVRCCRLPGLGKRGVGGLSSGACIQGLCFPALRLKVPR